MLKEKHLKLCYELEPNELKTIKTGGRGECKLSHVGARMLAQTRALTRGNSGTCPVPERRGCGAEQPQYISFPSAARETGRPS